MASRKDAHDIKVEAMRLNMYIRSLPYPNSPNKTHFMARVKPDILKASDHSSKILSHLYNLGIKEAMLTQIKGMPGIYLTVKNRPEQKIYFNGGTWLILIKTSQEYALMTRIHKDPSGRIVDNFNAIDINAPFSSNDPTPFIAAWCYSIRSAKVPEISWGQGHYCATAEGAMEYFLENTK